MFARLIEFFPERVFAWEAGCFNGQEVIRHFADTYSHLENVFKFLYLAEIYGKINAILYIMLQFSDVSNLNK